MKWYFVSPLILQKLIWVPTRLTLRIFGRMEVNGLENLKGIGRNAIFAMNHTSEIDPFVIPASLPFWSRFSPLFYTTREKAFYDTNGWRQHLFGGAFINMWGGYTVRVGLHDYAKSLVEHVAIIREGGSFCIFPEGGISPDGTIQPGKGGVAYMAEAGGCPIIPVVVSGAFRTRAVDFFRRRRKISVRFGAPICREELAANVVRDAAPGTNVYKEEANYVMGKIRDMKGK